MLKKPVAGLQVGLTVEVDMRIRLTPFLVFALLVATSVGAARGSQCADAVQGKIAWDYAGSKDWASKNVERLCAGAEDSAEPARCFGRVMHGGIDWGGGIRWQWVNALNLCKGTRDAEGTVGCFLREREKGRTWQKAIGLCTSGAPSKAPPTATLVTEIAAEVVPFKSGPAKTGTASERDDGKVVEKSAAENVVHAACPDGRTLIAGGCRGVGGDALIASNPVGDTWVCQFTPRERPLEKTAMAICSD